MSGKKRAMAVPDASYIGGRWTEGEGDELTSVNPADAEDVVLAARCASAEQVTQAIEAAAGAFDRWSATPAVERARYLARVAELIRPRATELARSLTREEGKILADARAEIDKGVEILERFAAEGRRPVGEVLASGNETMIYTRREPLGVVGLVTPWNVPFALPCWKLAPALAAGNTVVLKPSSLAPGMALALAALFEEAELPSGVLNVVLGAGSTTAQSMAAHPAVRGFSFTGSPGARAKLHEEIARRLARFNWSAPEAGGKNAVVVLADADLDAAAAGILFGAFASTGQRCTATSRVIVDEAVADALCERLVAGARATRVGDGLRAETEMGPVIDGAQLARLTAAVAEARAAGTPLLCGGERLTGDGRERGFFIAPTIFDHVEPRAPIARRELFGPVLAVTRVADFEEALAVANDSPYRLAGSLYTRDASAVMRYVERAEARMIHINGPTIGGEPHQPYAGVRGGGHLCGDGLEFFTETKTVFVDSGARRTPRVYY